MVIVQLTVHTAAKARGPLHFVYILVYSIYGWLIRFWCVIAHARKHSIKGSLLHRNFFY